MERLVVWIDNELSKYMHVDVDVFCMYFPVGVGFKRECWSLIEDMYEYTNGTISIREIKKIFKRRILIAMDKIAHRETCVQVGPP